MQYKHCMKFSEYFDMATVVNIIRENITLAGDTKRAGEKDRKIDKER